MRLLFFLFTALMLATLPEKSLACSTPPPLLTAAPERILRALEDEAAPYLTAIDEYSVAMEACYDGPLGPLELAPFIKASELLHLNMAKARRLAEDRVRDNELDYEELLSSALWTDLEAMRVASAYAQAWGALAASVRHISAEDKKQALTGAIKQLQLLSFEFKHPVLVQRSMYGLATAQIEGGRVRAAANTLKRLQQSLARGGAPAFKQSVDDFFARITAPGYQPPAPLFDTDGAAKSDAAGLGFDGKGSGKAADKAIRLARQALGKERPASEIVAILEPALRGTPDSARAALALIARDQLLLRAMDYAPGPSLRVMQSAFGDGQYGQVAASWTDLKPYYPLLPPGLKRRVDYQLGVARLNLGELILAQDHLAAARKATVNEAEATRIDKLIVLARLSIDKPPDAPRLALAKKYRRPEKFIQIVKPPDAPPPTPEETLDNMLDLRARIVLARDAAARGDWPGADKNLTGIGPDEPAHQLFLGMRVRLLAEAIRGRIKAGENVSDVRRTARGGHILYRMWHNSACPPGCPRSNDMAVHRAAFETALMAELDSTAFGFGWGAFVEAGGDIKPFIGQALAYLVAQADQARLTALLEDADEDLAAVILSHWKRQLRTMDDSADFDATYAFLTELIDLQGRPRAVLLEALIGYDLKRDRNAQALVHAEELASGFPRRPSAWFWRAAALEANQRGLEAARALSALAQRTPADDPVGMGARLGLAAIFIGLERGDQACAMRQKIFSRPEADNRWRDATKAFPLLEDWQKTTTRHCG